MNLVAVVAPTDVGIDARELARRMITPPRLVQTLHRDVGGNIALLDAKLHAGRDTAVGAKHVLTLEPAEREAVLHLETDGATERVETEHRVVRLDVGAVDRVGRD